MYPLFEQSKSVSNSHCDLHTYQMKMLHWLEMVIIGQWAENIWINRSLFDWEGATKRVG